MGGAHASSWARRAFPTCSGATDEQASTLACDHRCWLGKGVPKGRHSSSASRLLGETSAWEAGQPAFFRPLLKDTVMTLRSRPRRLDTRSAARKCQMISRGLLLGGSSTKTPLRVSRKQQMFHPIINRDERGTFGISRARETGRPLSADVRDASWRS